MIKPNYFYEKLLDIELDKVVKMGKEYMFCDLDNTLCVFNEKKLRPFGYEFISKVEEAGLRLIIISNNKKYRVEECLEGLDIEYIFKAHKPFKGKCIKFIKDNNLDINKGIIVGDQLYTDVLMANHIGLTSILVTPLLNKDLLISRLNRGLDKKLRAKLNKKGLLHKIDE